MTQSITIKERALNDDVLHIASAGKVFKGQLVAVLEYYTYANEWSNKYHRKGFKTIEAACAYIDKHYKGECEDIEIYQA